MSQLPRPLHGVRVIELEGIGPGYLGISICLLLILTSPQTGPLGACMLADFGAEVVTICRAKSGKVLSQADPVSRGKRSIALNLKSPAGLDVLKDLASKADVFIEPFRPGVVEKMGCGPEVLCKLNPKLIYGRMTGFGQGGTAFEKMAGHDSNYLALSGKHALILCFSDFRYCGACIDFCLSCWR